MNRQQLLEKLSKLITTDRYEHTLSTEKKAIELATIHGYDVEKASLAALLHDCAKSISKAPKDFSKDHGIEEHLDKYSSYPLCVLHAPMGAHLAEKEFGVTDEDILSSITWHTSGKPGMSKLDKIIYIADITEDTRPDTDDINAIRELSKQDLDKAMAKALECSIKKIQSKGNPVHDDTTNAYEYYKKYM